MNEKIICTKCSIPHVENCNSCFGFGFVGNRIISAGDAETTDPANARPCPECGGYLGKFVIDAKKLYYLLICERFYLQTKDRAEKFNYHVANLERISDIIGKLGI